MKKLLSLVLLVVGIMLILQNCKHEIPIRIDNTTPVIITQSDTCSPDTVYFVNDVLPIIRSNCAQSGCHDEITHKEGVVLTNYDAIMQTGEVRAGKPSSSKLYEVLNKTGEEKMPPPPASLTAEQKNAIRLWILQGAKNNFCQNTCDTSNVTYSANIWPIMELTCKGCHSGAAPSGGVSITNYTTVKALVDNGKLDGTINHRSGYSAMPPGGSVTNCAKAQIRLWIDAGAPNN